MFYFIITFSFYVIITRDTKLWPKRIYHTVFLLPIFLGLPSVRSKPDTAIRGQPD